MKKTIALCLLGAATLLYAQQHRRREHMICPIDGQRMDWDGYQQQGFPHSTCEFSHDAYVDGQRTAHKSWASCVEDE